MEDVRRRGAAKVRGYGEVDVGGHHVREAVQCECTLVRDGSAVIRPHDCLQQVIMLRYRCSTQSVHARKATLEAASPDMVVQETVAYAIRLGILSVEVPSLVEGKGFECREIWTKGLGVHRVEYTLQDIVRYTQLDERPGRGLVMWSAHERGVAGREQQFVEVFDRQLHRQTEADHGVAAGASLLAPVAVSWVERVAGQVYEPRDVADVQPTPASERRQR